MSGSDPPAEPPSADRLDEFGLPRKWRRSREEIDQLSGYPREWNRFQEWCDRQGVRAFPASVETVYRFVLHGPLRGRSLYGAWVAIMDRHEAFYWHTDANPALWLPLWEVADVTEDGEVHIQDPSLEAHTLGPPDPSDRGEDPGPLDEYGLPREWRRDPEETNEVLGFPREWKQFEEWCGREGVRAFPASEQTVARFLLHGPLAGRALHGCWVAISQHHENHYWHRGANPVKRLQAHGAMMPEDGSIEFPDGLLQELGIGDQDV